MSKVVNMMTVALILPAKDDLVSKMAGVMTGYAMIPGRGTSFKGKKVKEFFYSPTVYNTILSLVYIKH